jgi:hypothetical protein
MRKMKLIKYFILLSTVCSVSFADSSYNNPYSKWKNGPPHDANFFPIAVWLQSPRNAGQYKQAGINTYVGLWQGPTDRQITDLKKAGIKIVCHQNETGLKYIDDPTIIGWMHGDEPDNAQSKGKGQGYDPPIEPERIIDDYINLKKADPSRPVLLNLGQAVAWDHWHGRGVRTNHPEDYPEYLKGCDITSFDIYPAVHSNPQVAGKLWYVAKGVDRLVEWSDGKKIIWNCIECTRIQNPDVKATPRQVRAEVWMSLIHGSTGIIYFVHEWQPEFNEAALLSDPEMLGTVTEINRQILDLAPVINNPTIEDSATVTSEKDSVQVAIMVKKYKGQIYLFAVGMRDENTNATFILQDLEGLKKVEVLGEERQIISNNGVFKDSFANWGVHIYRIVIDSRL